MQDVHIICAGDQVQTRAEALEQEFKQLDDEVVLIDWGQTQKLEQGYIILEWDEQVDEAFLARLNAASWVLDYCLYDVPCTEFTFDASVPVKQYALKRG